MGLSSVLHNWRLLSLLLVALPCAPLRQQEQQREHKERVGVVYVGSGGGRLFFLRLRVFRAASPLGRSCRSHDRSVVGVTRSFAAVSVQRAPVVFGFLLHRKSGPSAGAMLLCT